MPSNSSKTTPTGPRLTAVCPACGRIKPEPKLRPWKPEEAPKVIVMRDKRDDRKTSRIYELQPGGFYRGLNHPHDWTLHSVSECCIRLLEDGSESPCGVMEDAT